MGTSGSLSTWIRAPCPKAEVGAGGKWLGGCTVNVLSLKHPSAWLPLAMSLAAMALVLGHVALFGIVRQADEGAAARIFQLIMVAQAPIIAFFALRWLPRSPKETMLVLALQAGAWLAPIALVAWLES